MRTLDELNEYFKGFYEFTFDYGCDIFIYTNKRVLYEKFHSNDLMSRIFINSLFTGDKNQIKYFNTPNQYYASLLEWIKIFNHKNQYMKYKAAISFVEVYNHDQFIARNFIRFNELLPFHSELECRNKCPYIRKHLITNKPILDWSRIVSDRLSKPIESQTLLNENPAGFLKKYRYGV